MSARSGSLRRVGLNALFLTPARSGMGGWALELPGALRKAAPDLDVTLYATREAIAHLRDTQPWADDVRLVEAPGPDGYRRPVRVASEMTWLPIRARRDGIQVLHSLANLGPLVVGIPHVLSVHDLLFWHVPETHPGLARPLLKAITPLAARRATAVGTPSRYTAEDLVATIGLPADKVQVIHNGPGMPVRQGDAARVRQELELANAPVVLSLGVGFAHKNVERLLEAFAQVGPQRGAILVHVGPPVFEGAGWEQHAARLGIADHVRWPSADGFVSDERVEDLYAAATLLVHPSLHEGFGLPPLEAMARGIPVACSSAASLPEVAGDAAEYFPPRDTAAIAAAIAHLLDDPARRAELIALGTEQAARFSWERNAAEYAALYREAFAATSRGR